MTACATVSQDLFARAERRSIPINMMLELTYRCNERCLHCYLPETQGLRPTRAGEELTAAEWNRVLEELVEAGTLYLILTGGEVILRPDLLTIMKRARELYFNLELFTNATLLTPELADAWAELDVASVGVSCYSPDAVRHDRMTKLKGSFDATMRGVRLLKERGITVTLKSPLMRMNLANYSGLISLAEELGVAWKFDPMVLPRNDGSDVPTRLGLDDAGLERVYRDEKIMPRGELIQSAPMDPSAPTCSAGRTSGAISPFGDVVPCIQWMVTAGNVRRQSFAEIWQGGEVMTQARSFTAADVKPCPDCGKPHLMHCLGMSELERKDPLVPSTECCRLTKTIGAIQDKIEVKP